MAKKKPTYVSRGIRPSGIKHVAAFVFGGMENVLDLRYSRKNEKFTLVLDEKLDSEKFRDYCAKFSNYFKVDIEVE